MGGHFDIDSKLNEIKNIELELQKEENYQDLNKINSIVCITIFQTSWIFIWISGFKQKTAISLTILPKLNISIDFLILTVIIIVKFICIRHDVIGFFA